MKKSAWPSSSYPDKISYNWNNVRQINMGNNLYNKSLAKNKLFPLESLRTFIGFTYLYVICHSVTVSLGHVS